MSPWRERVVDLDGPVRVVDYGGDGDGPPLVCVHGLGGCAFDWQVLAPELTGHRRVLALDLPGFGNSPPPERSATVDAQQRLVHDYLTTEIGEPAVVLGNSMGAMISVLQAVRRPWTVAGLVLVAPVLPASLRRLPHPLVMAQFLAYLTPRVGEWYLRARREWMGVEELVDGSIAFLSSRPERIPREIFEQRYELVANRDAATDRAFLDAARSLMSLLLVPGSYERLMRDVDVPTLVVHGTDDPLVSVASAQHLATVRPDWSVHVMPDVGHVPMLEAPQEVAALVRAWLAGTDVDAVDPARGQASAGSSD